MIAAAAAAMVGGAFANACEPERPVFQEVARVYQVQLNVYTTKGVAQGFVKGAGSCDPEQFCLVRRGKDKTVIRGYVYVCENICELTGYSAIFADVRRGAILDSSEFTWNFCNVIGSNNTDAEIAWDFTGTAQYTEQQAQEYNIKGAGYGKFVHASVPYFDNLGGYFAGTATASYDLRPGDVSVTSCLCEPSKVLTCDTFAGLEYDDSDTVAFGAWKMKFNRNLSEEYMAGEANFIERLRKMFK